MPIKKLGKATANIKEEIWFVQGSRERFCVNRRLVDSRPERKSVKSKFAKSLQVNMPSTKKVDRREKYFSELEAYKRETRESLEKIYADILQDSHERPVLLRREKEFGARALWRFCLYKGMIYQFNRSDYSSDEMMEQIMNFEKKQPSI